jgi:hypothetical protein
VIISAGIGLIAAQKHLDAPAKLFISQTKRAFARHGHDAGPRGDLGQIENSIDEPLSTTIREHVTLNTIERSLKAARKVV